MKKLLILAMALTSIQTFAVCDSNSIKAGVEKYSAQVGHGYGAKFKDVKIHGILTPGKVMNVEVSIDDFNIVNRRTFDIIIASLYGTNMVGASFWLAEIEPKTCQVLSANEVLGEGGAGL